jgi:CubicO group peptidase (beta-lactamase class C family)
VQKIFVILAFFTFDMTIAKIGQSQSALSDSTTLELKKGMEGFKNRFHSPSIVVAIVYDNRIIFSDALGYTDVENKIPATVDSKYPILSVTKTFTATMFMQLVQQKKINLLDEVKKFVPEYSKNPDLLGKDGTTLFQLATHTSGLPRNSPADISFTKQIDKWMLTGANYASIEPATKKEFLQSLKFIHKEYPEYEFLSYGDRHYSNLGYSLLGIALERAAKTDYAHYVSANICKPLNMNSTGFDTENLQNTKLAKGYYYNDSTRAFVRTPTFKSNAALYAGGMYSTATDLAKYISFQFDGSAEAKKVLSKENRALMQTFKVGWKPNYPFVLHEGSMLGYRCQVAFNPEIKIGWVILTNTTDFEFSGINNYISKLLMPIYSKQPATNLNKYTGTYKLEGGYDSLRVYLKNDTLYSTYLKDVFVESSLISTGKNKFKSGAKGNYSIGYEFLQNDDGEIKCLNLGQLMWVKQYSPDAQRQLSKIRAEE